ncbi:adenylate/guanylate cyclase domain-containing protein [Reyranella sp.]|uniref:adenylate/guanylate cyclase domain-containing protein n=1 Tax=Reyranella sp. TaxID=1929291 RepID=UPI003BAC49DA
MLNIVLRDPVLGATERRWHQERRSAWLRLVALAILVVNLGLATRHASIIIHNNVVIVYGLTTITALALAELRRGPAWLAWAFVTFDALLVVVLFHEHLFAPGKELDHDLTAPSLAIGFVLLTHVAMRLRPIMVLLFSGLVVLGWLTLLVVAVEAHLGKGPTHALDWSSFMTEGALAAAFGFSALVCALLAHDHNVLLRSAVIAERRRANLSRFFSPAVLNELQASETRLPLSRRQVAVMFVDLRSFTRLSEDISLEELAKLLAEFRELITREVFAHGGMIDKFIGDGVMAAFGQPKAAVDDATRAVDCALHLESTLREWREARRRRGEAAPDAGIGLHFGVAIGGVLHSGSHDEFTLIGDAVNVAQRLERLCKTLGASIVASCEAVSAAGREHATQWRHADDTELEGRAGRKRITYLPRKNEREVRGSGRKGINL